MTCEEVKARLAEGVELPEEGEAHLAACANCRAAAQRWAAVRQGLAALRAERQPPFLHARIMAAVRQAAANPLPWWRCVPRAAWASAGVAAVLVVGVLATQGVLRQPSVERAARDEAARPAPPAATTVDAERRPSTAVEAMAKPSESVVPEDDKHRSTAWPPATPLRKASPPARRAMAQEPEEPLRPRRDMLAQAAPAPFAAAPSRAAPRGHDKGEPPDVIASQAVTSAGREELHPAAEHAAARASAPRWRRETAVAAPPPAKVAVTLLAASGEEAATLLLDEAAAPPPAAAWVVVIGPDGQAAVEGTSTAALEEVLPAWQHALAGAELPAGRYLAVRFRR